MLFVLIVLVAVLCAVSLYALDVIPAYTAFVGRAFGLDAPPAAVPPVVAPATTPAPSKPASAGSTYVAPIASCGAAIDCDTASKLALAHYSASPGAQPGAQITRVASAADHNACNYAFTIPGTMKTVHVDVLGHSADVAVPFPQEERRFVFARDPVTCAPTTVDVMGEAGSGFMVENAVAGTLSLGGMCAVPQGGKTSDGVPVELQQCDAYAPAQLWAFDPTTGQIHPQGDRSYCLDVEGVSKENGAKIQLWGCNDVPGQKWSYDELKGEVRSGIRPGFCLEAPGGNNAKGTRLGMWDCNGFVGAQRFATTLFR